jgi:phage terminase small subunit
MPRTSTVEIKQNNRRSLEDAKAAIAAAAHIDPREVPDKKRGKNASLAKDPVAKNTRQYRNTSSAATAALIDPNKPLTLQQHEFAKQWASGETITNASIRAGYADTQVGYRLARMPNVLRVYNEEKRLYEEAAQMTRKKVMDMHLEAYQMARLMAEPATMVSAAREIGKMCGYYEPVQHRVKIDVQGEVTVRQLNSMTDAELLKMITDAGAGPLAIPPPQALDDPDNAEDLE